MNTTISSLLGPKALLPALSLALCYPLLNWRRPVFKIEPKRRLSLAAYSALAAYAAIILAVNYSELFLWHHVPEFLYPALGGAWGIEHVGALIVAFFVFRRAAAPPELFQDVTIFLRGRRLIPYAQALDLAVRRLKGAKRCVWWGMTPLRVAEAVKSFLIVGAPGSGKTVAIRLLLKSVVPWMTPGSRTRMLLYDAKTELWPILAAMKPGCRIRTLNTPDGRVEAWDMAKDIRTRKDAGEAAAVLVPESPEKNESAFFVGASRLIVQGVIESLILSKKDSWTLRDLVLSLKSPKRVEAMLSRHPETRHILANLAEAKTRNNVLSTVQNIRERLSHTAAVWHKIWPDKSRRLSLTEWIHGESILLLGQATTEGSPVRVLNQLVIQRIADLLEREPESEAERTWLVLDELTDLEHIRGLDLLLRKGRSRGVATVLGFQTWPGMVRAFQRDLASEITALCAYKSFLGVNDPPTAEWAAAHFGQQELLEYRVGHSESESEGKRTVGRSRGVQQVMRPSVMPEELLTIPQTNEANGFTGYHLSPEVADGYKSHVAWPWVMKALESGNDEPPSIAAEEGAPDPDCQPPAGAVPLAIEPWGKEEVEFQYLPDWTAEECQALGIPPVTELDGGAASSPEAKAATSKIKNISRKDLNS